MAKTIEQLESEISTLQEQIISLKQLVASGFRKVEMNFVSVQMNIGMLKRTKLADEIKALSEVPLTLSTIVKDLNGN